MGERDVVEQLDEPAENYAWKDHAILRILFTDSFAV
jgi:hypothetical protein